MREYLEEKIDETEKELIEHVTESIGLMWEDKYFEGSWSPCEEYEFIKESDMNYWNEYIEESDTNYWNQLIGRRQAYQTMRDYLIETFHLEFRDIDGNPI